MIKLRLGVTERDGDVVCDPSEDVSPTGKPGKLVANAIMPTV